MNDKKVLFLVQAAAIAAVYIVLTMIFAPISFGEVQIRISEALTVLPFFTPAAIPGLRRNKFLVPVPPIVANVLIVPFVLRYGYGVNLPIPFMMLTVGAGEVVSCGVLGLILLFALDRYRGKIFAGSQT